MSKPGLDRLDALTTIERLAATKARESRGIFPACTAEVTT